MATVQAPAPISSRIRHPLQAVRGYIRSYVMQEGIALAIAYVAAAFWLGLALDYGIFVAFHYDWVLELNFIDETGAASFGVRAATLLIALVGLGYVIFAKVLRRYFREFGDAAVALVLERRFPRELGDRLITAVELADPRMGPKLGYSSAFIAQTIQEAGTRVAKLPVARVFDWARLRVLWLYAALMTLGVFLVVSAAGIGLSAALGGSASPGAFLGRFAQTATIWSERNLLLRDVYWPRNSLIELVRFQDSEKHPGEMRIGRDEQRPDLTVRAVKWAVADQKAIGGWRSLRVADLERFLPKEVLASLTLPAETAAWVIDLDDLDRSVPNGVLPAAWHGKTAGEIRKALVEDERVRQELAQAKAEPAVRTLLDWRQWTVDRLELQIQNEQVAKGLGPAAAAVVNVLKSLEETVASTAQSRSLRKLEIPKQVSAVFRGEQTKSELVGKLLPENKYLLPLKDLSESARFHVRGNDAFTPTRSIVLAPPPVVVSIAVDKEEPAYIYHRVQGDQMALKGKRQVFRNYPVSVTGDLTTIDVPFGASLVLTGKVDRTIKETLLVKLDAAGNPGAASALFVRGADGLTFRAEFRRVEKLLPLIVTFFDEDNVRGERRIRIRPIDDQPPEILGFELGAELRKPRFQDPNKAIGVPSDGLLITPDAALPFNGVLRDDIGLTRGDWAFEVEQAEFELASKVGSAKEPKESTPSMALQGGARTRRAVIATGLLRINPALANFALAASVESFWTSRLLELDAKRGGVEETAPIAGVAQRLQAISETPLAAVDALLTEKPGPKVHLKEYNLKGDEIFDLRKHLPKLKSRDPSREAQLHYILKVTALAADNNVETGPGISRSKTPITFLVVSENELLAQIAIEEEMLREKLEKQYQKLKAARITLDEQIAKLSTSGDPALVLIRIDEVRKAVLDGGSGTREVHTGYAKIYRELEINRAKTDKLVDVRDKIVRPLEELVNPNIGHFADVDGSVQKLYEKLDEDLLAGRTVQTRDQHLKMANVARTQLDQLLAAMDRVLAAMDEGIVFSKLLELAISIETGVRQDKERLKTLKEAIERLILEELINPKK